ncbi:MAG: nuclear transport factor 2 family protein [Phyllobacterium sp.]
MSTSHEKTAIASVIEDWSAAIRNKEAARALSHLTDDIVQFTLAPPLHYSGKQAEDIQGWFDTWDGPIGAEARDVEITAGDGVAFVRCLVRMTGTKTDGQRADLWFRQTLGLTKQDKAWKIAHAHASVPFYMDGSFKAAIDLEP